MAGNRSSLDRRPVRRVLVGVLLLNVAVAFAKLLVGWAVGSIAMVADGFHSLTDGASNVVGLVGVKAAERPPDANHPYGHRKYETLAAMLIGALLAATAWEVLQSCLDRLVSGGAPTVGPLAFGVMAATMMVNLGVTLYERRRGRELDSEVLLADAAHTASDLVSSTAVLASLIAAALGVPQLDAVAALAITAVIGRAAFSILRSNAQLLSDVAALPPQQLRAVATAVAGVESVHKIRTRGPRGAIYADLHVQVDPGLRLDQAHVIGHLVADRLREELGLLDVVVHVEPIEGHRTSWQPPE